MIDAIISLFLYNLSVFNIYYCADRNFKLFSCLYNSAIDYTE